MLHGRYESGLPAPRMGESSAAAATIPEMRAFCLNEAARCESVGRQSLETPTLSRVDTVRATTRPG
jgi:hypothetical protein